MGDHEWIDEEALATALAVDRTVLRARRPYLLAGEVQQHHGAVQWKKTAAARVAAELGLVFALEEKNAAPAQETPPPVETLTVLARALNPRIVNAARPNGERVAVYVVDNRKYVPVTSTGEPMTLRARKATVGNWWVLVGREPRWIGKW